MSEFENEFEDRDENIVENVQEEAFETQGADSEEAEQVLADSEEGTVAEVEPVQAAAEPTEAEIDEQLWDKTNKAARLLRNRRAALQKEQEERGGRPTLLVRAIKLLELKPEMTQKEMADLLGVKLHELDTVLEEAEKNDVVARVEPAEPDKRKIVVKIDEESIVKAEALESRGERFVPGMSSEETAELLALLDKVINKLTAMGLDDEREKSGDFKGRDRRDGGRGGFGGGRRDDRNGRNGRGGFGGSRGNYRGGSRGSYGDRGGRSGFGGRRDDRGGRDDRSGRGGFGGGRRDDRGSFRSNRGNRY